MKLNKTPNPLNREARNKENDNWEKIEGSIKRIDDTVSDLVLESGGDSNLEVVQARGGKTVLNERLNEIEDNVTGNFNELDNKINDKADISTMYANLDNKVDKGGNEQIKWSMLDQTTKENITGGNTPVVGVDSVNTVNLVDNSATSEKRTRLGERAALMCLNGIPNIDTNNRTLTFSKGTVFYAGKFRYQISNTNDVVIDLSNSQHHYVFINQKTGEFTVLNLNYAITNLKEDDMYIATISFAGNNVNIRSVDIGSDYTINGKIVSRVDNIDTEQIRNRAVTSEKRTLIGNNISIIAGEKVPDIDMEEKTITFFNATYFYSGKEYRVLTQTINVDLPGVNNNYLFFNFNTNSFKVLTSVHSLGSLEEDEINIGTISFVGGGIRSIDIPCDYTVNGRDRYVLRNEINLDGTKSHYKPETIPSKWYEAPVVDGYEAESHYADTIELEDIYNVYDNIVTNNPDYASKIELGLDSSGQYPIYRYEFKPGDVESSRFDKIKPKIILFTNTHGEEKSSTISLRNFIHEVATNWQSNPLLEYVRFNVHLIIIPVVNPYGFVNHRRKNANNVDINRNSSYRWDGSGSDDPNASTYKGSSPFSEVETQYVRDTITENLDAIACFDYHMNGTSGEEYRTMFWHWLESFTSEYGFSQINILSKNNISQLTRESQKRYNIPNESGFIGYISYNNVSSTIAGYAYSNGIPSATIECTKKIVNEQNVYSAQTMQLCTEFIGNALLNSLRVLA